MAQEARNGGDGTDRREGDGKVDASTLTPEDRARVSELSRRDPAVRAHERAHKAAAGAYDGAVSLSFATGPDGRRYAVGGEVPIDTAPVPGDPRLGWATMAPRIGALGKNQLNSVDDAVDGSHHRHRDAPQCGCCVDRRESGYVQVSRTPSRCSRRYDRLLGVGEAPRHEIAGCRAARYGDLSGAGMAAATCCRLSRLCFAVLRLSGRSVRWQK